VNERRSRMAEAEVAQPADFDSHRIAQLDRSLEQNLSFHLVAGDIDGVDGAWHRTPLMDGNAFQNRYRKVHRCRPRCICHSTRALVRSRDDTSNWPASIALET
jgi:hypothetical protein